jgi:hypothetical protein
MRWLVSRALNPTQCVAYFRHAAMNHYDRDVL